MKTRFVSITLFLLTITGKLFAQTAASCDCKIENGKNVLVVTGSVTLSKAFTGGIGAKKYTYTPGVQIVNKSSCTMQIIGFSISNGTTNPKMTIAPNSPDQDLNKPVTAVKPAAIIDKGGIKLIKATVRYTLNGKPCSQVVDLLFYEETAGK